MMPGWPGLVFGEWLFPSVEEKFFRRFLFPLQVWFHTVFESRSIYAHPEALKKDESSPMGNLLHEVCVYVLRSEPAARLPGSGSPSFN